MVYRGFIRFDVNVLFVLLVSLIVGVQCFLWGRKGQLVQREEGDFVFVQVRGIWLEGFIILGFKSIFFFKGLRFFGYILVRLFFIFSLVLRFIFRVKLEISYWRKLVFRRIVRFFWYILVVSSGLGVGRVFCCIWVKSAVFRFRDSWQREMWSLQWRSSFRSCLSYGFICCVGSFSIRFIDIRLGKRCRVFVSVRRVSLVECVRFSSRSLVLFKDWGERVGCKYVGQF